MHRVYSRIGDQPPGCSGGVERSGAPGYVLWNRRVGKGSVETSSQASSSCQSSSALLAAIAATVHLTEHLRKAYRAPVVSSLHRSAVTCCFFSIFPKCRTKIRADLQSSTSLTQSPSTSRLTPAAEHISIKLMSSLIIFKLFLRADTLAGVKLCGQVKINQPYCALLHRSLLPPAPRGQ